MVMLSAMDREFYERPPLLQWPERRRMLVGAVVNGIRRASRLRAALDLVTAESRATLRAELDMEVGSLRFNVDILKQAVTDDLASPSLSLADRAQIGAAEQVIEHASRLTQLSR